MEIYKYINKRGRVFWLIGLRPKVSFPFPLAFNKWASAALSVYLVLCVYWFNDSRHPSVRSGSGRLNFVSSRSRFFFNNAQSFFASNTLGPGARDRVATLQVATKLLCNCVSTIFRHFFAGRPSLLLWEPNERRQQQQHQQPSNWRQQIIKQARDAFNPPTD